MFFSQRSRLRKIEGKVRVSVKQGFRLLCVFLRMSSGGNKDGTSVLDYSNLCEQEREGTPLKTNSLTRNQTCRVTEVSNSGS